MKGGDPSSFIHRDYTVRVYRQNHPDYPPWVATATRKAGGKVFMFNVEGRTMQEAADTAKTQIEEIAA